MAVIVIFNAETVSLIDMSIHWKPQRDFVNHKVEFPFQRMGGGKQL